MHEQQLVGREHNNILFHWLLLIPAYSTSMVDWIRYKRRHNIKLLIETDSQNVHTAQNKLRSVQNTVKSKKKVPPEFTQ